MEPATVSLTIPAKADCIDVARLTLYGVATRMGYSFEEIEDMKVAVSEACNNAVLHGYGEEIGRIELTFEMLEDRLRISVADDGGGVPSDLRVPRQSPLLSGSLSDVEEGGLGIFLMQALMDEMEVNLRQSGTEIVMTKYLSQPN